MTTQSILWRGYFLPGHEACQLSWRDDHWHLRGTAVFSHEDRPCWLDYHVICDSGWGTRSARVDGWLGDLPVAIEIEVDASLRWRLNGMDRPEVAGCIDLDLNFSPSTNLLPIRRLGLKVGGAADVQAAWLRFPSFELERLPQRYLRLGETRYRYESADGQFVAELTVNEAGFVTDYPGIWLAEAASG